MATPAHRSGGGRYDRDQGQARNEKGTPGEGGVRAWRTIDHDPIDQVEVLPEFAVEGVLGHAEAGDDGREGVLLWSSRGPTGGGGLGVGVGDQDAAATAGEFAGNVHRKSGFAGAAFLVDQGDDASGHGRAAGPWSWGAV